MSSEQNNCFKSFEITIQYDIPDKMELFQGYSFMRFEIIMCSSTSATIGWGKEEEEEIRESTGYKTRCSCKEKYLGLFLWRTRLKWIAERYVHYDYSTSGVINVIEISDCILCMQCYVSLLLTKY